MDKIELLTGVDVNELLDCIETLYYLMSHDEGCAYRHSSPCTCVMSEVVELLAKYNREV